MVSLGREEKPRIAVVVPTNRPERIAAWWEAWRGQLAGCSLYIIEDTPHNEDCLISARSDDHVDIIERDWSDIDADLGADSWIIPRRTDCVRSYGFLLAYRAGADIIMTMDDDCLPSYPRTPQPKSWVEAHRRALSMYFDPAWENSVTDAPPFRGAPYGGDTRNIPTVINHGLWDGIPDYDAVTTLAARRMPQTLPPIQHSDKVIRRGRYFPMCGMNLAFTREIAPAMYFLLMGQRAGGEAKAPTGSCGLGPLAPMTLSPLPFDRAGDIWAGVIAKRICDHLGYAVRSGSPHVLHERASDPFVNLRKEAAAIGEGEVFWKRVDAIRLTGSTAAECYAEVARAMNEWDGEYANYWRTLSESMGVWLRLLGTSE